MSRNDELADRFDEFADRLEADGVAYKPTTYRRAADNIREYQTPIEELVADGKDAVQQIDGVGDAIASKAVEYIETGHIEELDELRESLPVEIEALTRVEGVGPKTVGALYDALGIRTLDELAEAAHNEEIRTVSGFGPKTEENIRANIDFARSADERERLGEVRPLADEVLTYLRADAAVERADVAGSIRRWRDTIGDIDVLVATTAPGSVIEFFTRWSAITDVLQEGDSKASVRAQGVQIDLRAVDPAEFGAALQYFTGSKAHNVALRNRAIARELKMNEYGIFDISGVDETAEGQRIGDRIAGGTEQSMYDALELPFIPPELREDRGEVEAAVDDALPTVVAVEDISGDLHTHTNASDGRVPLKTMVEAALGRGYEYYAVTDHATGAGMVGGVGLTDDELREQYDTVATLNSELDEIELLHGVESNITADGAVSNSDAVLEMMDIVVASPHAALRQGRDSATERLIRAVEHPAVDILGHPSGRQINARSGLELDMEAIATAAADAGTALEINSNPVRLDLNAEYVRTAIEADATIAINTDAHGPDALSYIRYGVHTGRRGWCTPSDVLNTFSVEALFEFLH